RGRRRGRPTGRSSASSRGFSWPSAWWRGGRGGSRGGACSAWRTCQGRGGWENAPQARCPPPCPGVTVVPARCSHRRPRFLIGSLAGVRAGAKDGRRGAKNETQVREGQDFGGVAQLVRVQDCR